MSLNNAHEKEEKTTQENTSRAISLWRYTEAKKLKENTKLKKNHRHLTDWEKFILIAFVIFVSVGIALYFSEVIARMKGFN